MKIKPISSQIAVKLADRIDQTEGGIVIPEEAKVRALHGKVVAVGPGALNPKTGKREPLEVEVGDYIMFSQDSGEEREIDGEEYLFIRDFEILGIFEPGEFDGDGGQGDGEG
jgi:chaperonin GroES